MHIHCLNFKSSIIFLLVQFSIGNKNRVCVKEVGVEVGEKIEIKKLVHMIVGTEKFGMCRDSCRPETPVGLLHYSLKIIYWTSSTTIKELISCV